MRRILIGITSLMTLCVVVGAGGAVGPAAAAGLSCAAVQGASSPGISVTWTGEVAGASRYVVERNAFGTWEWRGRVAAPGRSFTDAEPGRGAIQLDYRVSALAPDRAVLSVVDCTVTFRRQFSCTSRTFELGSTQARWDIFAGTDVDYVVSAKEATGSRFWWQTRTEATSFRTGQTIDQRQPQVRVTVREGRRVVGSALCTEWNTVTTSQLLCFVRFEPFFGSYFGIRSSIAFSPDPVDTVVDWYRQTERGGPWEFRFSRPNVIASFNSDPPAPGSDPAEVLYRLELWNEAHTVLLNEAICDAGLASNRS